MLIIVPSNIRNKNGNVKRFQKIFENFFVLRPRVHGSACFRDPLAWKQALPGTQSATDYLITTIFATISAPPASWRRHE